MVEAKDLITYISLVVIAIISIGGTLYNAQDTGEEVVCRTGNGWTIVEEYDEGIYKAECQYKTKEHINAYCSSFRATPSYERYGCNIVLLSPVEEEPEPVEPEQQKPYVPYYEGVGDFSLCSSNPKTCVPCNPSPEGCVPIR